MKENYSILSDILMCKNAVGGERGLMWGNAEMNCQQTAPRGTK